MKILVIKQTSLGDVLHSTGHVRALKRFWPETELTLLTATGSLDIYRHSPHVDHIITVDRYRVKHRWYREPLWAWRHMREVMKQVRAQEFDLAFDLQGLAKSVLFLYGARARRKFVKGRWPGLTGFRDKSLHAITEMDRVLSLAGIDDVDTAMEFATSADAVARIDELLPALGDNQQPLLILSPFSRWRSKDWPLERYVEVARTLGRSWRTVFTGAPDRAAQIQSAIADVDGAVNLAGKLNLVEFAELVRRAELMLTGDSFPMHVASAVDTPVMALFGPTDESRVGPVGRNAEVIRAPGCRRCDRADCARQCLQQIEVQTVLNQFPVRVAATVEK